MSAQHSSDHALVGKMEISTQCAICGVPVTNRRGFCPRHRSEEARRKRAEIAERMGLHDRIVTAGTTLRPNWPYQHIDIAGLTFGRWRVERLSHRDKLQRIIWLARCSECNTTSGLPGDTLRRGTIPKCPTCEANSMQERSFSRLWTAIRGNAKVRNYAIDISREYAFSLLEKQNYKCAITGLPIRVAIGTTEFKDRRNKATASLDRIDSDKGYVEGNIWWVHKDVNRMKSDFPLAKLVSLCRLVAAGFPDMKGVDLEGDNSGG